MKARQPLNFLLHRTLMRWRSNTRETCMSSGIKLHTPINVSSDDVERALFEQAKEEPHVARVHEQLRGPTAQRAVDELNRVLDIDAFQTLARGWASVPSVRNAVQLSALMTAPPTILEARPAQHDVDLDGCSRKSYGVRRATAPTACAAVDRPCAKRNAGCLRRPN